MIGNILKGRYEIIDELGMGGMGIVYLAYCSYLKRHVAIKVLLQDNQGKEESLLQEAKAAARLSHGNIVQIYDIFEEDNKTYIVMEYVRGKTLRQLISNQEGTPFTEKRALELGLKLASALHHAHLNGVIHRDIKPDNIMIDQDGEPKITDFGIARVSNEATIVHTDEILGSLRYSSPEQLKGSVVDERADIFSLGIVLYEMLTGTMPFPDDSPVTAAFKKLKESIPRVTQVNPEVSLQAEAIVHKATSLDPEMRYRNMSEFYYAISQALESPKTYFKKPLVNNSPLVSPKEPMAEIKKKEVTKKSSGNVFIILGLLLALITVVLIGVPLLKGGQVEKEIDLPHFYGLSLKEAQKLLDRHKLLGVVNEAISSEKEVGTILAQSPEAGDRVEIGSTVYFTVSQGQEQILVPSLLGLDLDGAASLLRSKGLDIGTVKKGYHETVEKGLVIKQEIEADILVVPGTSVDITISDGPEEIETTVPRFVGYQLSVAVERAQLSSIILSVQETHYNAPVGEVVAQSIEENSKVKKDTTVTITVSLGPLKEEEEDEDEDESPESINYAFGVDPTTFSASSEGVAIEEYYLRVVIEDSSGSWELFSEYHEVSEGIISTRYEAPKGASYSVFVDALGQSYQVGAGVIQ
ncbi:MAG: Stk1 family PASTA domain-containing Ser/Thr kinase [Tissierellia bacterium]|nr:Stk1 family PASTA domain-containing Ser/Thr kinase [Tissierellia bacterium]